MPAVFVHGVPGCSHWWQLERSDAVAEELTRFWQEPPTLDGKEA